jgi:hypothetical protein
MEVTSNAYRSEMSRIVQGVINLHDQTHTAVNIHVN